MRFVEIISLRSSGDSHREVVDRILAGIRESDFSDEDSELREIRTYYEPWVLTDLSIHLHWESKARKPLRSALAARIYAALMKEGLLDYVLWAETTTREFSNRAAKKS
jgi:hypothetical protein